MFLLASSLLIIGISEEPIWTCTDGAVSPGCALSIPPAYHGPGARVLALVKPVITTHTRVRVSAVHIIRAAGLLDAEAILAAVKWRTLAVILTLADAAASIAKLVVQTVPAGLTGRGADAEAAEHAAGTLLLTGAELQLGAAQGGLPSEAGQTEAPGHVVESAAVSVLAAHVGQTADIHTLVTDTGPLTWAVGVTHTLQLDTTDQGVAIGPRRTGAHRFVIGWSADGISTTGAGHVTRVLTLSIVARCGAGTVAVGETLV